MPKFHSATSPANPPDPFRLFDIPVNSAILRQDVSEWLTQKERTCFQPPGSALSASVEARSKVDALFYVLLHEATHVVDGSDPPTPVVPPDAEAGGFGQALHGEFGNDRRSMTFR